MAEKPDYYTELGVSAGASAEEIKRAYRQRALDCHPDRGGSERAMRRLNEAWNILGDPETRRAYDATPREAHRPVPREATAAIRPPRKRPPREQESGLIRAAGWIAGRIAFIVGRLLALVFRAR